MQQPSQHWPQPFPVVPIVFSGAQPAIQRMLTACFLWWAVINTSLTLPDRTAYSSIHGPFQTGEQCLAFAKVFRATYDDRASGAQIVNAFCIEPYKKKVINEARAIVPAAHRAAGGRR